MYVSVPIPHANEKQVGEFICQVIPIASQNSKRMILSFLLLLLDFTIV